MAARRPQGDSSSLCSRKVRLKRYDTVGSVSHCALSASSLTSGGIQPARDPEWEEGDSVGAVLQSTTAASDRKPFSSTWPCSRISRTSQSRYRQTVRHLVALGIACVLVGGALTATTELAASPAPAGASCVPSAFPSLFELRSTQTWCPPIIGSIQILEVGGGGGSSFTLSSSGGTYVPGGGGGAELATIPVTQGVPINITVGGAGSSNYCVSDRALQDGRIDM
jgi:hypothetical protein